jgi:hypothetical protein
LKIRRATSSEEGETKLGERREEKGRKRGERKGERKDGEEC